MGQAIHDYYVFNEHDHEILVDSNLTEEEVIPVNYLFRSWDEMPPLEQKALELCKGKVLDVGAGSGCHSMELLRKGFDVTSLDVSELACATMSKRRLLKVVHNDFFLIEDSQFDTFLFL